MIYMEFETSKVVGTRDVLEGDGGQVVAAVDREGVEEGAVVDQGDDIGIVRVRGGHEDADVGTSFRDCCCEGFLGSALSEDDDSEVSADDLGNRGVGMGLKIDRIVEMEAIKVGKRAEDRGARPLDIGELIQSDSAKIMPIRKTPCFQGERDSADRQVFQLQLFNGSPKWRQRGLCVASSIVEAKDSNSGDDLEPLPGLRGVFGEM